MSTCQKKGCPERKVLDRTRQIPSVRERVHRQRLGQDNTKRARAQVVEFRSGEARLFLLGQEYSSQ